MEKKKLVGACTLQCVGAEGSKNPLSPLAGAFLRAYDDFSVEVACPNYKPRGATGKFGCDRGNSSREDYMNCTFVRKGEGE